MNRKEKKNTVELLAPAGNMLKMKTALAFGADAVYAGVPDFSLRVRINDFSLETLEEAARYCHEREKKLYATVNIFAHERHFKNLGEHIKKLKKIGVDGLIVSDPGVISVVKKEWPECSIHLSTQANCTNSEAARFWQAQGVARIILGREVTLEEIKSIHAACPDLELEYFVHGAMCMAYSGRCFLSKMYADRSANLGDCVQPCRWKYSEKSQIPNPKSQTNYKLHKTNSRQFVVDGHDEELELVEEEHGSYILNSKDLCLLKYLRDLRDAGVSSFKIEGRAKSVYYQAMVAGIYSYVIKNLDSISGDEIADLYKELETKLVHRGYTSGFLLFEKADQNLRDSHDKCDWEFCGQVLESKKSEVRSKNFNIIKVHNSLKVGDEIEIVRPGYDIIKMRVDKLYDAVTGDEIMEAHGGQGRKVFLPVSEEVPVYSVVRRRVE